MDPKELSKKLSACATMDRVIAARELCQSPEDARLVAVALVRAAGDEDEEVQEWATAALEELGTPNVTDVPALTEMVADRHENVAYWAVTLLGRLEADAAFASGALRLALAEDRPLSVRQRTAWALGRIGVPAASATESLEAAAQDADPRLARLATEALEKVRGG